MKAFQIMKDNNIRRLPVVKGEKTRGIVTDRDMKEATPSKATSLDVHEIYSLLSEIKVKDIMSKDLLTIGPDESIEKAAMLMLKKKVSGLPVMESGKLVGIITQTDIFRVLVDISGLNRGGVKIAIEILGVPITNTAMLGSLVKASELIKKESFIPPLEERFGRIAGKNISAFERAYQETVLL